MSKLTKAELMEGIFNTFKEKNDITNESRHIIENAIVSAAEKLDKHFKLECTPMELGDFLWDAITEATLITETVAFKEGFQAAVDLLTGKLSEMEDYINAD